MLILTLSIKNVVIRLYDPQVGRHIPVVPVSSEVFKLFSFLCKDNIGVKLFNVAVSDSP